MKSTNNRLVAGASIVVSSALLLAAFAVVWLTPREAGQVKAQNSDTPAKTSHITVRGSGSISVRPDTIVMNVGVSSNESTVKAAQDKVSEGIDAMVARLKSAGVAEADYRTSQYMVEPLIDYSGTDKGQGTQKLTGFRVVNMIEITVRDTAKAPELLDQLVSAGANTVYNVNYTFADADGLAKQAYEKAVQDAEERATRLAGLSNMTLGRIISVTEPSANQPGIIYGDAAMGKGGAGAILPGQQNLQIDVIVSYEATAK